MIKAVVFDYGKVICFPPDHGVMDEIANLGGVRREDLEKVIWAKRAMYDRGEVDGPEYYRRIFSDLGAELDAAKAKKISEIDRHSWKRMNPGTVKLMEDLKKAGYKTGILSNMPFDFLAWARKALPVFSLPDASVFSCEEGCIKPEEPIYRKMLSVLGCKAGEVVFFDDIEENVNKAKELKIHAFLWRDVETARRDLSALGLKV